MGALPRGYNVPKPGAFYAAMADFRTFLGSDNSLEESAGTEGYGEKRAARYFRQLRRRYVGSWTTNPEDS